MVGLFCFSMANLFLLRFKTGDIYPPYSSFKTGPMGTKALFDSLALLDGINVTRSFVPAEQIKNPQNTSIIIAGLKSGPRLFVSQKEYEDIERLTNSGCRLIIALTPVLSSCFENPSSKTDMKPPENQEEKTQKKKTNDSQDPKPIDLFEKLGITIHRTHFTEKGQYASPSTAATVPDSLTPTPWQQAFWFKPNSPYWETIYSIQSEEPVIIEKKKILGNGSIVLLADAYIFSNESLKSDNNSELLSWLLGNKKRILFDEYHLGVQKNPGISSLFKKYGLYGPAALFSIFIILVVWKQSAVLVPPDEREELDSLNNSGNQNMQTKDHMSGLTSLLKQHIPKKQLIPQCIEAWKNAFVMDNQASQKYARQYEKINDAFGGSQEKTRTAKTSQTDTYIQICHILSKKEKR